MSSVVLCPSSSCSARILCRSSAAMASGITTFIEGRAAFFDSQAGLLSKELALNAVKSTSSNILSQIDKLPGVRPAIATTINVAIAKSPFANDV